MIEKDKVYKKVEIITMICFAIGVFLACATRFMPFIFLTFMTYPISFKVIKSGEG